jgi:hypothetical protein
MKQPKYPIPEDTCPGTMKILIERIAELEHKLRGAYLAVEILDHALHETTGTEAPHDREWYQEHDPQSLVDSINAANSGNPQNSK